MIQVPSSMVTFLATYTDFFVAVLNKVVSNLDDPPNFQSCLEHILGLYSYNS